MISSLPPAPGTYAVFLHLPEASTLEVGRLGVYCFSSGLYVYVGSAFGQGGLAARLRRHLRRAGLHWHVDYLRQIAEVVTIFFALTPQSQECRWSQALAAMPRAFIPVPGFGASDCRQRCAAHLIGFAPEGARLQEEIRQALEATAHLPLYSLTNAS